jgi:hypothetical protein
VEELIIGVEMKDFYWSIRHGNTIYIAQRRLNSHRRYLELLEYGGGGQSSFMVIPEANEVRGWVACVA